MRTMRTKLGILENMGFYDRVFRGVVGVALNIPILIYVYQLMDQGAGMVTLFDPNGPQFYMSAASFYFLLTALIGWDPLYALFKVKSCGGSGRNRCGSFEYQAKSAMGNNPATDKNYQIRGLKPGEEVTKEHYDKKDGIVL